MHQQQQHEYCPHTCWNCPCSAKLMHTSHLSPSFSYTRGVVGPRYKFTYSWKVFTGTLSPFRVTCTAPQGKVQGCLKMRDSGHMLFTTTVNNYWSMTCKVALVSSLLDSYFLCYICGPADLSIRHKAYLDSLSQHPSHIKDPLSHQHDHIILQGFHAKFAKVRLEGHACPVVTGLASRNLWLSLLAHVCTEHLISSGRG